MKAHLKNFKKLLIVIFAIMTLMPLRLNAQELFFEETYHAVDIDNGVFKIGEQTAMDEARAWKFAAQAPGTINGLIESPKDGFKAFTAAYTVTHRSTGWVAKMLKEGQDSPKFYNFDDEKYYPAQVEIGAYENLKEGIGYGKCFMNWKGDNFLTNLHVVTQDTTTITPSELMYNRKREYVLVADRKCKYTGYVHGFLSDSDYRKFVKFRKQENWEKRFSYDDTPLVRVSGLELDMIRYISTREIMCVDGYMISGKQEGVWKFHCKTKNVDFLFVVATYKNGKLNGTAKFYKPDGRLYQEINYKDGKFDGYYIWYNEAGEIIYRYTYSNGERIKAEQFAEDPREFCD